MGGLGEQLGHEPIVFHIGGPRDFLKRDFVSNRIQYSPGGVQEIVRRQQNDYGSLIVGRTDDADFLVGFKNEFYVRDVRGR